MTALLQIRDVPDDARRVLKARAAERGQSLNSYLLEVIGGEVARPTAADVFGRASLRAERGSGSVVDVLTHARAEREEQLVRSRA